MRTPPSSVSIIDVPIVTPERRVDPAGFLDERGDQPWLAAEPVLEVGALGEDLHAGTGEARGGFAAGGDEQEEDGEGLGVVELTVVDGLPHTPMSVVEVA